MKFFFDSAVTGQIVYPREYRRIDGVSPNFVVKLPCADKGVSGGYTLEKKGIRTNITLVFPSAQAIQAGRIGAEFVSPFVAWKDEAGENCEP